MSRNSKFSLSTGGSGWAHREVRKAEGTIDVTWLQSQPLPSLVTNNINYSVDTPLAGVPRPSQVYPAEMMTIVGETEGQTGEGTRASH